MYREKIEADLRRGRNAVGIWQDLVDRHGFAGGYQSVRRFVRVLRGACCGEARGIIEAQAYLDHWEERWADKRIHGRTKRQVAAMFA
jgi:hypothetical protein